MMEKTTVELCKKAKAAAPAVAALSTDEKNAALAAMADNLLAHEQDILAANRKDLDSARGTISNVMMDRLMLDHDRIYGMADGIRDLIELQDPVGYIEKTIRRPNGLEIRKVRVPLGVIAIIYESRPNVTSDAASLAFKSGNVCVLRGGKESYRTSLAVVTALKEALHA